MGVIRDYFNILKPSDQDKIVKLLLGEQKLSKPVAKVKVMIAFIADIRNMCAHDELLLGYKHSRLQLPPLYEHEALNCKMKNNAYVQGSKDLLALLIMIKYFVNKTMYNEFIQDISSLINKCYNRLSNSISKKEFLEYIGLTENYEKLKKI